jgi:M3 family oligoendopeptidase
MRIVADFSSIGADRPAIEAVRAEYAVVSRALDRANSTEARLAAIREWDAIRDRIDTWLSLVSLRFAQDTRDPAAKADRDYSDTIRPQLTELEVAMKRRLIAHDDRPAFEAALGRHVFRLWESDITTFDPAISEDLEAEAKLEARYTELLASASIPFRGEDLNLSALHRWTVDADRGTRHDAEGARWGFFSAHRDELDAIYGEMVRLRTGMARKLGFDTYLGLGYRRLRRTDYGPDEVARYREQVATDIVPLAARLIAGRGRALGIDPMMAWDEGVADPGGNPRPAGDGAWVRTQAAGVFDSIDPRLGAFWQVLDERRLLDLEVRPGKAGGGFCTSFPTHGLPYIFANFNGTMGDVDVLTHEMGHAFQNWSSHEKPISDLRWPTMEAAEIHSMSLEFLSHPQMERFFEGDAERYRRQHLENAILFLPYGVAIDHFQHLAYARPDATAAERHAMWREVEGRYMPWRKWGDLEHPAMGGAWQAKMHVYAAPLYYIDYTLAQCCALQFWDRAARDRDDALSAYVALCARGGEAPFQDLVASAGLASPFAPGALGAVARRVAETLAV